MIGLKKELKTDKKLCFFEVALVYTTDNIGGRNV